jgi:hypothetical protein
VRETTSSQRSLNGGSLGERHVLIDEGSDPMDMNVHTAFKSEEWAWEHHMLDVMITSLE